MNERIQQFAKEAGAYFGAASVDYFGEPHPAFVDASNIDLSKFAELIVRECMSIDFMKAPAGLTDVQDLSVCAMIKKHFGVEE